MEVKQDEQWTRSVQHSIADLASRVSVDWMINSAVLLSMMLQLLLALGGAFRFRTSSSALLLVIWLAHMSADAVAIYALGAMAHNQRHSVFGIWAPILLSHLGGPDTITAYSSQDNDLWLRHLLNMLFQVSVAVYVVYSSELGGQMLATALLVLIVGASNYAERTMALRSSSFSQIVNTANPINIYLSDEKRKEPSHYLVVGLKQWTRSSRTDQLVTINDVWNFLPQISRESYLLCLSHALFKMVKRRCVDLYLQERLGKTTKEFLSNQELSHIPSPEKIFTVVETELKFLYDFLFSKSSGTAFSKVGTVMRLVNICLLGISGFLFYGEFRSQIRVVEETLSAQRTVAYVLLCVAFVLEIVQFCRILASDWTMVWLICAGIQHSRGGKQMDLYMAKLMQFAIQISNWFRMRCPGTYWKNQISQYSIIHTCSHISPWVWNLTTFLRLSGFVTARYTHPISVGIDLKTYFVEQLKHICPAGNEDVEDCRNRLMSYRDLILRENNCEDLRRTAEWDAERELLYWHIATTICEMQREAEPSSSTQNEEVIKRNVSISGTLSRYCAYLMVSTPKLLPVHPEIANVLHMEFTTRLFVLLTIATTE